jgi:hypothetical protein
MTIDKPLYARYRMRQRRLKIRHHAAMTGMSPRPRVGNLQGGINAAKIKEQAGQVEQ